MTANLQTLDWNSLRLVLAFGDGRSLARAARSLQIDATTVARRLRKLERELGVALVISEGNNRMLSSAGEQVLASARAMQGVAEELVRHLGATESRAEGVVRLTALPEILMHLVMPKLGQIRRRHPRLILHLLADARNLAVGREEADLAIRLGRPNHPELTARKLFDVPYVIAGPSAAGWITFEEPSANVPEARWVAANVAPAQIVMRSNSTELMAAAVRNGHGQALIPQFLCADLRHGLPIMSREAWLVMHKDTRKTPRIRAVADWLVELSKAR